MTKDTLTPAERLLFGLYSGCARMLGRLGPKGIRRLADVFGAVVWHALPSRRELAVRNIRERLGISPEAARTAARKSFSQNMQSFLECILIPNFKTEPPQFVIDNPELIEQVLSSGRPLVVSTLHLGAWELLAALPGILSRPGQPSAVVVRRYGSHVFNQFMASLRGSRGLEVFGHRNAVRGILRILSKKGIVAFLVDHHACSDEALTLPFFGKNAAVNMGPAVLAVRAQALIWPVAILRENGIYRLHTQEPLDTQTLTGETETKIHDAALFYTQAAERMIRLAPEQWFWMHNRWK